jgi:Na+/melibiose symporter-like transporter
MVLFLFGHKLHVNFTLGMMVVMGVGFGFTYAMPYAIVPDAIDDAERRALL